MKHFSKNDINAMDRIYRLNLVNSCTGYKSANLIGSVSSKKIYNVAVFSSITHLGSDPAMLTFIVRPTTVPRDTYRNIIENKEFTVNHIHLNDIEEAHHPSAKYPSIISEFDMTKLEKEFIKGYNAPFVKTSKIKLGCKFLNQYEIKENNTLLMVAEINDIFADEAIIQDDGWLNLEIAKSVTVNGLDGYALPSLVDRFEYAKRKNE